MFDWKKLTDLDHTPEVFSLSEDTLAILLSMIGSFQWRTNWLYDGDEVTDSQWDDIESALSLALFEITTPHICPPGGGDTDYTLHDDITLVSDATTYTLDDLDLLSGLDLLVTIRGLTTNASDRHLNWRLNGDSGSNYDRVLAWTQTSFAVINDLASLGYERLALSRSGRTVEMPGYAELYIPRWKDTGTHKIIKTYSWYDNGEQWGRVWYKSTGKISSLAFFGSSDDLKIGTQIAVYSRG